MCGAGDGKQRSRCSFQKCPLSPNYVGNSDTVIYTVAGSQMFRESAGHWQHFMPVPAGRESRGHRHEAPKALDIAGSVSISLQGSADRIPLSRGFTPTGQRTHPEV